uniref:Uncharacterized protein n=1 Tax=Arundo donax TaxID=35708 RepID=A0A0A9B6R3_ARUDO
MLEMDPLSLSLLFPSLFFLFPLCSLSWGDGWISLPDKNHLEVQCSVVLICPVSLVEM